MAIGSGRRRAEAFMVLATLLYRVSHLVVGFTAVVQYGGRAPIQWLAFAVAVLVTGYVFGVARSRGWFTPVTVLTDLLVVGCALPLLLLLFAADQQPSSLAWLLRLGGSATALAAVTLGRVATGSAVLGLTAIHLVTYQAAGAVPSVLSGHLNALVSSAVLAWVFWWYLRRQGRLLDDATARALAAETERARFAERITQYRKLHDTVLSTLTAIARGGVDTNTPAVRARCAREASYLRRLLQQGPDLVGGNLASTLEEAVLNAESLGLRVTTQYHQLPDDLPGDVVTALGQAVTEALNNVHRHAGTGRAWLTATQADGHVLITVVDRGAGFDPQDHPAGRGLRDSVHARIAEAGGRVRVDSGPGDGVLIELRWPG